MYKLQHLSTRNASLRRALALAGVTLAASAMATVLAPGGTVPLHGTTLAAHPFLKATDLQDVNHPITLMTPGGPVPAMYHERVAREVAAKTIDFYFWLEAVKKPIQADKIEVTLTNYKGFATDVEYRTDGIGHTGPFQAQRDATGNKVTFTFRGVTIGNTAPTWTRASYIRTTSRVERQGGIATISVDGKPPATVKIFEP
ncbi:MAG TPA: hypothetical protein VKT78_20905 [Fimbriimonadaceae bacterium]|nr:hypothetical protein [Fimbriimonadaceae bacterium]